MDDEAARIKRAFFKLRGRTVEVLGRGFELPASRAARIAIGVLLLIGGLFSFLPILGVWMLPLGFMVLSIDIALVRRARRRAEVRWKRRGAAKRMRRPIETPISAATEGDHKMLASSGHSQDPPEAVSAEHARTIK